MNGYSLTEKSISQFHEYIFSWWQENRRDLPWRHTHDPYKILVSELMLQQTQVSRVLPKYHEFLSLFPTVFDLAKSSAADVLIAWKGMGYNRRALYLKKLSEVLVKTYSGKFPEDEQSLLALPGLGKYTARAVLVFAFQQDVAMVDTNIRQIIVHHFFKDIPQKDSLVQQVADLLVPTGRSWDWHQALMDYGSSHTFPKPLKTSDVSRKVINFRESNRFYRGKIIDYLREKPREKNGLVREMIATYGKDPEFLQKILDGLMSDGLIERSKTDIISLPS